MTTTTPAELSATLEVARELARRAGEATLLHFCDPALAVQRKGDPTVGEPVTEADRASEAIILEGLRRAFPGDGILSEEQTDTDSWARHPRAWVIDPLDGTVDFIAGRHGFAIMIGLLEGGRPVLGAVRDPVDRLDYWAALGQGAWVQKDGEPTPRRLVVSAIAVLPAIRLVASRAHRSPLLDEVKRVTGIADEQNLGSVGLKVGLIGRAERDLYLNLEGHSKLWDICAPEAILLEAGGEVSDLDGAPIAYRPDAIYLSRGIVASNRACHRAVIEALAPLLPVR
jgi:3'(2'), 5'-bisphosphate nucleotidase